MKTENNIETEKMSYFSKSNIIVTIIAFSIMSYVPIYYNIVDSYFVLYFISAFLLLSYGQFAFFFIFSFFASAVYAGINILVQFVITATISTVLLIPFFPLFIYHLIPNDYYDIPSIGLIIIGIAYFISVSNFVASNHENIYKGARSVSVDQYSKSDGYKMLDILANGKSDKKKKKKSKK